MYKLKALNLLLFFSPLIFFHSFLAYVIPLDLVLFCFFFVFLTNSVPSKIRTEVHSWIVLMEIFSGVVVHRKKLFNALEGPHQQLAQFKIY